MNERRRILPPVVWLGAATIAMNLFEKKEVSPVRRALGGAVTAGATVLGGWAIKGFASHQASFDPQEVGSAKFLVTDGAHSVSRHPMYLSMVGCLLGRAIQHGQLKAFIPVAALWLVLENQAGAEEDALSEKFGRGYLKYQDQVPKWL